MENTKCYCCAKSSTSGMDVDSALNELGMLSSVTDSRRQYLKERQQRTFHKGYSDPFPKPSQSNIGIKRLSGGNSMVPSVNGAKPQSECSIQTNGYQILTMNPLFVTGLTSGSPGPSGSSSTSQIVAIPSSSAEFASGVKYQCETLEYDAKSSRSARLRLSRARRFKKPYEVPWRLSLDSQSSFEVTESQPMPELACNLEGKRTHDRCSSNASTPEKSTRSASKVEHRVPRSRSLDDLKEFEKLKLSDSGNFIAESREIDNVSRCLNNLSVQE